MGEIPSDIGMSGAQAGFQGQEVAKEREARRAGQADASQRQVKSVNESESTVETNDADVAIFADAEGSGGQGRENEETGGEEEEEEAAEQLDPQDRGVTQDDNGQLHVDIEV